MYLRVSSGFLRVCVKHLQETMESPNSIVWLCAWYAGLLSVGMVVCSEQKPSLVFFVLLVVLPTVTLSSAHASDYMAESESVATAAFLPFRT